MFPLGARIGDFWKGCKDKLLPGTGRGTTHRVVEGAVG